MVSTATFEAVKKLVATDKQLDQLKDELWEVIEGLTEGLSDQEIMDMMDTIIKGR